MDDGDRDRFEALFAAHFDVVLRFAMTRAEPETAKDVASETFLAAWRAIDELPAAPRGWLLAVARHKLADHYRSGGRRDKLETVLAICTATTSPDHADRITDHDHVRVAFARLPAMDQEVLRLLAWDGLTRAEAAESLGCSTALFAVRLHRARRRLRDALNGQDRGSEAATQEPRPGSVAANKESR